MAVPTEQLIALLRDQAWSPVIGISAPILASIFNTFRRRYQEITYKIHKTPGNIVVRLWNSGNMTINPEDFKEPFEFSFLSGAYIQQARVLQEIPGRKGVEIEHTPGSGPPAIILKPFLFRPREEITLEFIVSGVKDVREVSTKASIDCTIREITAYLKKQPGTLVPWGTAFVLSVLLWAATLFLFVYHANIRIFYYLALILLGLSALFATMIIISIFSYYAARRKYK